MLLRSCWHLFRLAFVQFSLTLTGSNACLDSSRHVWLHWSGAVKRSCEIKSGVSLSVGHLWMLRCLDTVTVVDCSEWVREWVSDVVLLQCVTSCHWMMMLTSQRPASESHYSVLYVLCAVIVVTSSTTLVASAFLPLPEWYPYNLFLADVKTLLNQSVNQSGTLWSSVSNLVQMGMK